MIIAEALHRWQHDVHMFHQYARVQSGNYEKPMSLHPDVAGDKAKSITWRGSFDLYVAYENKDLEGVVLALLGTAHAVLATMDLAGVRATRRLGQLLSMQQPRGWRGWSKDCTLQLQAVIADARAVCSVMSRAEVQRQRFDRFDLLDDLLKQIVQVFHALGLDPQPFWEDLHAAKMEHLPERSLNPRQLCHVAEHLRQQGVPV